MTSWILLPRQRWWHLRALKEYWHRIQWLFPLALTGTFVNSLNSISFFFVIAFVKIDLMPELRFLFNAGNLIYRYKYAYSLFSLSCSGNKFLCLLRGWHQLQAPIQVNFHLDLQRYIVWKSFILFVLYITYLNALLLFLGGRSQ